MKRDGLLLIGFAAAFVPLFLLFASLLQLFFQLSPFAFLLSFISRWPLFVRVIFYNTVFFVFPLTGLVSGVVCFRQRKKLSILIIMLSLFVLAWSASHLAYD